MMGYYGPGSYKGGGSSSTTSNLSPLAPPFKIEKPFTKPDAANASTTFSNVPPYGTIFDPAGPFWNSSSASASASNIVATDAMGSSNPCSTSHPIYGYPGSQPGDNSSTGAYYVSPNNGTAYDPFTYDQFPSSMSRNGNEAANTYYPGYVAAPPQEDGYLSLGVASAPSFDLLSSSGSTHLSGCVSTQGDHTQVNVGGRNEQKWDYPWSWGKDPDNEKWNGYTAGFSSKDCGLSNSFVNKSHSSDNGSYKNHPTDAGNGNFHLFSDRSTSNQLKEGACVSQGIGSNGEGSTVPEKFFDIFGGASSFRSFGLHQPDHESFELNSKNLSKAFAAAQIADSKPFPVENPYVQEPAMESVTDSFSSQKDSRLFPEQHYSQVGSFVFGCTSATNTRTMTASPFDGSSSQPQSALSASKLNYPGSNAANKNTACGLGSSYQNEPWVPLGPRRQCSIIIRRPRPIKRASSGNEGETLDDKTDDKDASDKSKFSPQVPPPSSLSFDHEFDNIGEVKRSIEKSTGTDSHNPAEDSPCWRGASSSRVSPFSVSVAGVPDIDIERCNSQEPDDKSIPVDSSGSNTFSTEKVNESRCLKDNQDCGFVDQKSCYFDLNSGGDLQVDDYYVPLQDCSIEDQSISDSVSKTSMATQHNLEGDISSGRTIPEVVASRDGVDCSYATDDSVSGVPLDNKNDCLSSTPGDKSRSKYCKAPSEVPDSRIDVDVLLKTMMRLSQLFRGYCFSNPSALTEQHLETVTGIIINLNASKAMKTNKVIATAMGSSHRTSFHSVTTAVDMVGKAEDATATEHGNATVDFLEPVSHKDVTMREGIKKILHENLCSEEMDEPGLVYRDLWLEAEAALCAVTAKARFCQMKNKIVGENDGTDGMSDPSRAAGNLLPKDNESPFLGVSDNDYSKSNPNDNCNNTGISVLNGLIFPNPPVLSFSTMQFEGSKSTESETCLPSSSATCPDISGCDSLGAGTIRNDNNMETSVMARYEILKQRADISEPSDYEGKQSSEESNYLLDEDFLSENSSGNGSLGSGAKMTGEENDVGSMLARYQILKCREDDSDLKDKQSPEEHYLAENELPSLDEQLLNSQSLNSLGVTDDNEASVMARFRVIQSRVTRSNSVNKDLAPDKVIRADVHNTEDSVRWSQERVVFTKNLFGPYPDLSEDEGVKENLGVNDEASARAFKSGKMNSKIYEGWYSNDCSTSDWEHVSEEEIQRFN